ncbi:MAG: protein-glutamate O-methyltransferase CheR [Myxococcaceae bacterium]|nr:protein-glutamate O-methyltransferase CheR [Myxococcaceae bacterium]
MATTDAPTLSDADFERVRRFIKARAGIELGDGKRTLVVSRLLQRLRHDGAASFGALLDGAERDEGAAQRLVNALTTNVTSFFREAHHFELLASLLTQARRPLRIWSSACSTGEEAWSIAGVVLATGAPRADGMVLATDIDSEVLSRAAAGVYPVDRVDAVTATVRQRLLLRGTGANTGLVRVSADARRLVRFEPRNLLGAWPPADPFDVIFCRNVLIYFDPPTRSRVVQRLSDALAPQGTLLLGHSESLMGMGFGLTPCGKTAFRKQGQADARRAA